MLELLTLGAAGAAGIAGHLKSKGYVKRKLRFTKFVDTPGVGLFSGVATAVVAVPLIAALPLVGAGVGLVVGGALGAGVGTGVHSAAKQSRS
jgi:hypothetical protein